MEKERCYEVERVPTKEEVYGEEMDPRAYINLIDHRINYEEEDRD